MQSLTYSYTDALSRARDLRQSVIDNITHKATTYGYDGLDRLHPAQTKNQAGSITENYLYAYDRNSNRSSETGSELSRTTTYAYGAANLLTRAGTATYAYDADGNETSSSAGRAFACNAKNQATSYTPIRSVAALGSNLLGEGQGERTITRIGNDCARMHRVTRRIVVGTVVVACPIALYGAGAKLAGALGTKDVPQISFIITVALFVVFVASGRYVKHSG